MPLTWQHIRVRIEEGAIHADCILDGNPRSPLHAIERTPEECVENILSSQGVRFYASFRWTSGASVPWQTKQGKCAGLPDL